MGNSAIPYCTKALNHLVGCPPPLVSEGCKRCWARELHDMRHRAILAGKKLAPQYRKPFSELQVLPERLGEPLRWRTPQTVFVGSQSDLFHDAVSVEVVAATFGVMAACREHLFLTLTKRPERMLEILRGGGRLPDPCAAACRALDEAGIERGCGSAFEPDEWPLRNVVLGATACNQSEADRVLPILGQIAAAGWRTWLSVEPMLEQVDLSRWLFECTRCGGPPTLDGSWRAGAETWEHKCPGYPPQAGHWPAVPTGAVEWVAVGCESATRARWMDNEWARWVVAQCRDGGVRVFVKQLSMGGRVVTDPARFPEDLRIRELPVVEP